MNSMAIRIKERRKALGLTQEELAAKLGIQKSAIAKYENGRVENIKRSVIKSMAKILDCSPTYLMGFDQEIFPESVSLMRKYSQLDNIDQIKVSGFVDALLLDPKYKKDMKSAAM